MSITLSPKPSPANSPRPICSESPAPVPKTFRLDQLVICRYENLDKSTKHVLRVASILGATFSRQVLYGILPRSLKPEISSCLAALVQQQWLWQLPNELDEYSFNYDYSHRIIYEITPDSERTQIHRTVATYLEELSGGDPIGAAQLAFHFGKFDSAKALYYTYLAAGHILQKNVSFELCDCLDMLFIAVDFCTTVYDVEVLLRVGSDATEKTEMFRSELIKNRSQPRTFMSWFPSLCVPMNLTLNMNLNFLRSKRNQVSPTSSEGDAFLDDCPAPAAKYSRREADPDSLGAVSAMSESDDDNISFRSFNTQAGNYFADNFQELRTKLLQRKREILLRKGEPGEIKDWQVELVCPEFKPQTRPRTQSISNRSTLSSSEQGSNHHQNKKIIVNVRGNSSTIV